MNSFLNNKNTFTSIYRCLWAFLVNVILNKKCCVSHPSWQRLCSQVTFMDLHSWYRPQQKQHEEALGPFCSLLTSAWNSVSCAGDGYNRGALEFLEVETIWCASNGTAIASSVTFLCIRANSIKKNSKVDQATSFLESSREVKQISSFFFLISLKFKYIYM